MQDQKVTVIIDRMGSVHIWRGEVHVNNAQPCCPLGNGKQAEILIQDEPSITDFFTIVSNRTRISLQDGYIVTTYLPAYYFDLIKS